MLNNEISDSGETTVVVPAKTVLFKENDFSKEIYIVKRGSVLLQKKIAGRLVTLMRVEVGGIFGEISMFDNGPRTATAITIEDSELVRITPTIFSETVKSVPEWFMAIARVISQRIRQTDNRIGLAGPIVNEANVAAILLYLFSGDSSKEGLELPFVTKTMVDLLNISYNELDLVFASLSKKKIIDLSSSKIGVTNLEILSNHLTLVRNQLSQSFII